MSAATPDTLLQVLHEHYQDTFAHIQSQLRWRDRLFVVILGTTALLLVQMFAPQESGEVISQVLSNRLGLRNPIDVSFVGTIIWFGALSLAVRYFQTVVHLERQYTYIHLLEEYLSSFYPGGAFTREGRSYLEGYPKFSTWTWILYTIGFPVLLMIIVVGKIAVEIRNTESFTLLLVANISFCVAIVISITLYLLAVHHKK